MSSDQSPFSSRLKAKAQIPSNSLRKGRQASPKATPRFGQSSERANSTRPPRPRMRNGAPAKAKSNRVRVWWPPTDDQKRSGYSGMYWPADVLTQRGDRVQVQYDNGDKETVNAEDLQPGCPPVAFGGETRPLQAGEFVEVSNDSTTDPAEWVGVIKAVKPTSYTVSYPFHNSDDEDVKESLIRRARVWDIHLGCWLCVQPLQEWSDGEVTSPVELCLCTDKELTALLAELRQGGAPRK